MNQTEKRGHKKHGFLKVTGIILLLLILFFTGDYFINMRQRFLLDTLMEGIEVADLVTNQSSYSASCDPSLDLELSETDVAEVITSAVDDCYSNACVKKDSEKDGLRQLTAVYQVDPMYGSTDTYRRIIYIADAPEKLSGKISNCSPDTGWLTDHYTADTDGQMLEITQTMLTHMMPNATLRERYTSDEGGSFVLNAVYSASSSSVLEISESEAAAYDFCEDTETEDGIICNLRGIDDRLFATVCNDHWEISLYFYGMERSEAENIIQHLSVSGFKH